MLNNIVYRRNDALCETLRKKYTMNENDIDEDLGLDELFIRSAAHFHRLSMKQTWILLSKGRFIVLHAIDAITSKEEASGGVSVSMIAETMHASLPAVSRMLRMLEKQGLIERFSDPRDRRNTLVILTDEGRSVHDEASELLTEYVDIIVDDIGAERVRSLIAELEHCTGAMERALEVMRERHPDLRQVKCPGEGRTPHGHRHCRA
jgi:DNA-binding MarR family transcriptional regulator